MGEKLHRFFQIETDSCNLLRNYCNNGQWHISWSEVHVGIVWSLIALGIWVRQSVFRRRVDRSRKNEIKGNKFLGDAYVVLCLFTGSHERCRWEITCAEHNSHKKYCNEAKRYLREKMDARWGFLFRKKKQHCKECAQRIIVTDGIYGRRRGHASNNLYYKGSPYSYVQKIE